MRWQALILAAAIFCAPLPCAGADVDRQATIVARALAYEQTLPERAGDTLVIAVIYRPQREASKKSAETWARAFGTLAGAKLKGLPVRVLELPFDADLPARVTKDGIDVLFAAEGLDDLAPALRQLARSRRLLTVGSTRAYVEGGMTLGVFHENDKFRIVVNLSAAEQERIRFSSQLLHLAEILRS